MNSGNKMQSFGRWDHVKLLGEGGFGEVHHFRNKYNGQEIATKRLKFNPKLKQDEIEILHKRWRQEYEWMKSLKTSYIVGALKIDDSEFINYLKGQNVSQDLPVIVMEFCNGGDLRQYLNKFKNLNGLCEHEVRTVLRTVRYAIEYLHQECNIEHRDIKPENIVIQQRGNEKHYKLTDFGYARDIPEATIAQSIVGTRNYVAPEIIDPGVYSKTVDYWAIGVMAYEIICGERPFIPHQNLVQTMREIKKKSKQCIAIKQTDCESYRHEEKICPENYQSPIFIEKIEKWLQLTLDNNYKTRGFHSLDKQFKFYTELDEILASKILTVYCLKTHKIYYYEIESFTNLPEFFKELSNDTGIMYVNIFMILPTSHPKKSLSNMKIPMDLFVPEWCDTSNPANPPVMLYVNDYQQCDFNVQVDAMKLSDSFKACMNKDAQQCRDFPAWLLQEFEKSINFILSNEQRLVECYLNGTFEHVISVENDVSQYKSVVDELFHDAFILNGRILQFSDTVNEVIKTQTDETAKLWQQKAYNYIGQIKTQKKDIVDKVQKRYKSVLQHCNELAKETIYETLAESDIFKVKEFQQFLSQHHLREDNYDNIYRMEYCQRAFEKFIKEFENFIKHQKLKEIREDLNVQFKIFLKIQAFVKSFQDYINKTTLKLSQDTKDLMSITTTSRAKDPFVMKMLSLSIDGNDGEPVSSIFMNGGETVFDLQTAKLIEDSNNFLTLIDSTMMNDDEDNSMHVDIPTTIPTTIENV